MKSTLKRPASRRAELLAEIGELPSRALLTAAQAAAYLNTSTGVLGNWRSLRRGPRYHGSDDFIRYRLQDLDGWLSQRAGEVNLHVQNGIIDELSMEPRK